jgi:hypothetical protein
VKTDFDRTLTKVVRPMVGERIAFFGDELLRHARGDGQVIARTLKEVCIRRLDLETACKYRDIERREQHRDRRRAQEKT